MNVNQNVINNIRSFRKKQGMTQKDLGDKLNISRAAISKKERGECAITIDELSRIGDLFGVPASSLINDKDTFTQKLEQIHNDISNYSIKDLRPNLHNEYNNLTEGFKQLGQVVATEAFKEVSGFSISKIKKDIITDVILEYKDIIKRRLEKHKGNTYHNEVIKVMKECVNELLSNHYINDVK